jgi:ABC-type lipoprotein release transport system permease subunit
MKRTKGISIAFFIFSLVIIICFWIYVHNMLIVFTRTTFANELYIAQNKIEFKKIKETDSWFQQISPYSRHTWLIKFTKPDDKTLYIRGVQETTFGHFRIGNVTVGSQIPPQ